MSLRGDWLVGIGVALIFLAFWAIANSTPSWLLGPGPEDARSRATPAGWDSIGAALERDSLAQLVAACSVAIDTARDNTFQRITGRKPER